MFGKAKKFFIIDLISVKQLIQLN